MEWHLKLLMGAKKYQLVIRDKSDDTLDETLKHFHFFGMSQSKTQTNHWLHEMRDFCNKWEDIPTICGKDHLTKDVSMIDGNLFALRQSMMRYYEVRRIFTVCPGEEIRNWKFRRRQN